MALPLVAYDSLVVKYLTSVLTASWDFSQMRWQRRDDDSDDDDDENNDDGEEDDDGGDDYVAYPHVVCEEG